MIARWLPLAALGLALAGCASLDEAGGRGTEPERALARQLLITMRQESGPALSVLGDPASFYLRRRSYGPAPSVDRALDEIAADYGLRRIEGWHIASIGEYCEVYEMRADQGAAELIERLSADPRIGLVQRMNVFETEGVVYDDPYASMQPALSQLAIETAHEIATGRDVLVAVVDSSVDSRHRELRGKITTEQNLVDARSVRRGEVHGTAVAGVIGSAANNGEGIVGVAPESAIASLRACWTVDATTGRARCSSFSLAQALDTAIRLDADIVNLSLAGPPDPLLGELIDAAIGAGMIVVAALPSRPDAANGFPTSHPLVIAAESSEAPAAALAANRLRAPGAEVMSTAPDNGYAFFSGNSMSAAYIAGVSALIRERRPDIRAADLLELLATTGDTGSVNACRAVAGADGADSCTVD